MRNSTGNSRFRVIECTAIGAIRAVRPRTRPILVILDPSALPTPIAGLPCQAATAETSISGAEVPNPTMVRPIISGLTPRLRAVAEAPATKRSAPQTSRTKPPITANDEYSNMGCDLSVMKWNYNLHKGQAGQISSAKGSKCSCGGLPSWIRYSRRCR